MYFSRNPPPLEQEKHQTSPQDPSNGNGTSIPSQNLRMTKRGLEWRTAFASGRVHLFLSSAMSRTSYDRYALISKLMTRNHLFIGFLNRYLTVFSPEGRLYQVGSSQHPHIMRKQLPNIHLCRICLQGHLRFRSYGCRCQRKRYSSRDHTKESSRTCFASIFTNFTNAH
jgi:hypothetical protein